LKLKFEEFLSRWGMIKNFQIHIKSSNDKFCYLGDMIGAGEGSEEASRARVKLAWGSFRELAPILMT